MARDGQLGAIVLSFRVEAKAGDSWRLTRLSLLCHVQQ